MQHGQPTSTSLRAIRDIRFEPGRDTGVAVATLVAFWPVYWLGSNVQATYALAAFSVLGNLFLNTLFPAYYVRVTRGEPLSSLGMTSAGWRSALGVSILLATFSLPRLSAAASEMTTAELIPHVIANGLLLWEPFFVYGWLQLRYERAFGTIPAIVLTGASFCLYHVGTYPLEDVVMLAGYGMFYAVLFRALHRNLLVLWPLTWAVASGIGTLQGDLRFGWPAAVLCAAVLLVTAIGIAWIHRHAISTGAVHSMSTP